MNINQLGYKKLLNTKQKNRVQNIRSEVWEYKAIECLDI